MKSQQKFIILLHQGNLEILLIVFVYNSNSIVQTRWVYFCCLSFIEEGYFLCLQYTLANPSRGVPIQKISVRISEVTFTSILWRIITINKWKSNMVGLVF